MDMIEIASRPSAARNDSLHWRESTSVRRLLDVIATIIAKEYIATAKQNPQVFAEIVSGATRPRNDVDGR